MIVTLVVLCMVFHIMLLDCLKYAASVAIMKLDNLLYCIKLALTVCTAVLLCIVYYLGLQLQQLHCSLYSYFKIYDRGFKRIFCKYPEYVVR